ncbi:nuclear transport factor 2 family protein [Sphingobium sp.]|uniref:nuclear transport factor 2 family protein n=1 Tax=Sphingobium sp. TaxID=1912891 RepID=UPI002C20306A|nr:nuclear transport factor 2 family protein [Sphingobium sp.]HUD90258.1 nuclear transport factor 2 family protein [Sphingobium sp.]
MSLLPMQALLAQQAPPAPTETIRTATTHTPTEQQVIDLSKTKWDWMADKKIDSLATLFDDRAMFTHMGGTWGKNQELATIKGGGIWYKKATIHAVDVRVFGDTAIVLEDMDLEAVVGSRTVTNAFMVTEVYTRKNGDLRLAQLTFSHLLRPVKAGAASSERQLTPR